MVDLSSLLSEEDLRRHYGQPTLDRARDYVRRSMVLSGESRIDTDGGLDITGQVAGSGPSPYAVHVMVEDDGDGVWVFTRCSCPVHTDCKHAVALLLTVREAHAAAPPTHARRWEQQLSTLLDELDERADTVAGSGGSPLALQVDLRRPGRDHERRSRAVAALSGIGGGISGTGGLGGSRGQLRLRPLQRGSRGSWVRTGISWHDVQFLDRRGHPPEQVGVLGELLSAYRAASRSLYVGADSHLPLGAFGSQELRLLGQARDTGITFVPGPGLASVEVVDPVRVELDVGAGRGQELRLAAGVRTPEEWYAATDVDVIGETGAGVALWTADGDAWALTLAPLETVVGPEVRRLLRRGEPVVVPPGDRDDLVAEYLPRLQRHVPVVSSDGSVQVPERPEPRLVLTVRWVAADEIHTAWSWRYRVGADDRTYLLSETRGRHGVRRLDAERAIVAGLVLDDEQRYHLSVDCRPELGLADQAEFHDDLAVLFSDRLLAGLAAQVEVEEIGERPDYREVDGPVAVHFATRTDPGLVGKDGHTDWLDLEVVVTLDGVAVGLADVLQALTEGRDRIVLADGRHLRLDRPEFARLVELLEAAAEIVDQPDGGVRVGTMDLGLWDELAEVGIVDAQAAQWVDAARALREPLLTAPDLPVGVKAELRSYQREGFGWLALLWRAGLGGILADDMGLGKTLQTLALVAHARAEGSAPFLVVAPTSVVSAWAAEVARWTPDLVCRTVSESQSRRGTSVAELAEGADIVVTSYTLYRIEQAAYVDLDWGGLVLDEAQTVKNHRGKTYQAVRRLDVPFRLALTGTPLENRLMELWSLLSIVAPGLYPWPRRFEELVAIPVEKLGDADALARFRRRIKPFLLRRTKDLVASDLPPKQEQVLEVRLTPRHRAVYDTHLQRERQTVLGLLDDVDAHRIAIFRSLTRLRQLSLDAALVDEEYAGIGSAKADVLVDHLLELAAEGHRALVFSQFTSYLTRIRDRLAREGLASVYLDGSTRKRGEVVESFRTGDEPVFLISLKAGGVGLTLTEADYVFVLDPWWNPAVEAQAVDRAHRIGQTRPVNVYRLVAVDTIEEKVMALKERKAALFAQVIDDGALMSTAFDADDVRQLFAD